MPRRPRLVPSCVFPSLDGLYCINTGSASPDTLLVQAEQAPLPVVGALERPVRLAVVATVKLVLGVEGRGVERLVPVQLGDLVLDQAVVIAVGPVRGQGHRAPEPEVHVDLAG